MTENKKIEIGTPQRTETSPADYTADNAVSHGGRFGTDDTAPERSQGLPPAIANQERNDSANRNNSNM